jgi:predicted transposase YdaD
MIKEAEGLHREDLRIMREDARNEGLAEGRSVGLTEGLSEGRKEAWEKARKEKLDAARKLTARGLSNEEISDILQILPEDLAEFNKKESLC